MSLKKYITESERAVAFPVTGDVLEVVVREDFDDEIAIDFPVVEHTDNSITFLSDDYAYGILEDCNYVGDDTDGVIDPPSEELDEGIVKVTDIKWDAEDDVSDLSTTMTVPVPVGLDDEDTEEFIADYLTNKTGITHDGFRIAEARVKESSKSQYRAITNEGTVMERIKDGKIYCPEACCGVKVMDCTCGSKCSHCNCKTIQKLAGDIKMFEEQAALHKRLGAADTANYYNRKLTEAVEQTEKLIEDVEEVEAMITRRIMNHPEFSDMVREYGIEQITQAIADTAEFHGDDDDEIGSSDVSAMVNDTIRSLRRVIEGDGPDEEQRDRTRAEKMDEDEPLQIGTTSEIEDKYYPITYTADISYDDRDRIEVDNIIIHDRNGEMLAPDHPVYQAEVGFIEDEVRSTGEEEGEVVGESITNEAEYQGRKVKLNKPMQGDVKKFKVYVKDPKTGNVKKVNFGHGGSSVKGKAMKIRKNNPKARKSFRARHNCDNPGPKTKARYWSCRKW